MAKVELRVPAIITPWRRYCGEEHVGRPTLVPPRAVPARVARRSGRTRRIGGGDGTGAPATLPWTGRAPRWGYGPGPSRHLASTGPINLTVPEPALLDVGQPDAAVVVRHLADLGVERRAGGRGRLP